MTRPDFAIARPAYAYVPGQTPRHEDDAFEALCETARAIDGVARLERCKAWQTGLTWLREGYHWEAHELFEAVWMSLPPNAAERQMVQGLIQVANGRLKHKMGRTKAVMRIADRAEQHVDACRGTGRSALLGVPVERLAEMVAALRPSDEENLAEGPGRDRR